jgi:hypothetical protein
VHACRAQLDDLENTSDGQSLELLKLSQLLPRLGLLLGNLLRACTWLVTSRAGSEQPSAMPGRSGNRGSTQGPGKVVVDGASHDDTPVMV